MAYNSSDREIARKMASMQRARKLMKDHNVNVELIAEKTGVTESQVRNWMTPRGRNAPLVWYVTMCAVFDWSPTYMLFGIGPKTLTALKEGTEAFSHITETLKRVEDNQKKLLDPK